MGGFFRTGVEVLARGELWRTPFDASPVASLGAAVSIVSNVTEFSCFMTPSNSCRFSWHDAFVGRVDAEEIANGVAVPIDAAMELFRNGDVLVETNGVSTLIPRALPFPNNGFGQDGEWVAANFTNAAEIAAAGGYAAWVDAQVGTDLTNGLYKLTVSLADDPPETTFISVGDLSVAVTHAGEYVFLLGKGINYPLSVFPGNATNFVYEAVDDISRTRTVPPSAPRGGSDGVWTTGEGLFEIVVPMFPMVPGTEVAHITWKPELHVSPNAWQPSAFSSTRSFTAYLSDVPWFASSPVFHWTAEGNANVRITNPDAETSDVTCIFPHSYGKDVCLRVSASLGSVSMDSTYSYHVEDFVGSGDDVRAYDTTIAPGMIVESWPSVVFLEKGQLNINEAGVVCRYNTDRAGTFTLTMSNGECQARDLFYNTIQSGYSWDVDGPCSGVKCFYVCNGTHSSSPNGTEFTVSFTPEDESDPSMTDSASAVFVAWETETKAKWPADRKRRTIGVCEEVTIKLEPQVPFVRLESNSYGSLHIDVNGNWTYTAPIDATQDLVSSAWFGDLFSFDVLAPTDYIARVTTIESNSRLYGVAGSFAAYFDLTLIPTNVSFMFLQIEEVGMYATNVNGYFTEPRNARFLFHSTADVWVDVKNGNKGDDKAQIAELDPPWGDGGSMTWPTPNRYRSKKDKNVDRYFCNTDHYLSINAVGTTSEEKFGWRVSVTTNRIFTIQRTNTP